MVNMKISTKVIRELHDAKVIDMVPRDIAARLGDAEGSGFDLRTNERHLFFENGIVKYAVDRADIDVEFDD